MSDKKSVLVCATERLANSGEATCTRCQAPIFPTLGSLQRARQQNIPMICVDCYAKMDNPTFGGFMQHGHMIQPEISLLLFKKLEEDLFKKKKYDA